MCAGDGALSKRTGGALNSMASIGHLRSRFVFCSKQYTYSVVGSTGAVCRECRLKLVVIF